MEMGRQRVGGRGAAMGVLSLAAAIVAGCQNNVSVDMDNPAQATFVGMTIPRAIKLQRFTKPLSARDAPSSDSVRLSFAANEPTNTIEVYLATLDLFDDPVKATGTFHFELLSQRGAAGSRLGERIALWTVEVDSVEKLSVYWDKYARAFKFPLQLDGSSTLPAGRFVLEATYVSPWDEKLFDRYEFDYSTSP